MGRTLPWKRQGIGVGASAGAGARIGSSDPIRNASAKGKNVGASPPRGSPSPSTPSTPRPRARTAVTKASPRLKTPRASPKGTSSPGSLDDGFGQESPAGAPKPLPERFMISGLQHDDKWRMVEDEFVAMAHKLTAHLHAAEYQRLKNMAQDQKADAIRSLSRPVTAPMTDRVKRRQAILSLQKSQRKGIARALSRVWNGDEDESDELPWAGTHLEGLMDSPRKKTVPLTRVVTAAGGTRAAALSRKDSVSNPKSTRPSDTTRHTESSINKRKPSARFQQAQSEEYDDFEKGSVYRHSTTYLSSKPQSAINAPTSSAKIPQRASNTATVHAVAARPTIAKPDPANVAPNVDDNSDSPVETMFGKHFRERRNKRRVESSTSEISKDEHRTSEKPSKKDAIKSSLSIPSF